MSIEIQCQERPGYLLVKMRGPWTVPAIKEALDATKAEAERLGTKRILFDLLELSRPEDGMTRYYSGEYLARILQPPFKMAAFARRELINKFGETVASNRGAWFLIFSEEQEAVAWLLQGSASNPGFTPQSAAGAG